MRIFAAMLLAMVFAVAAPARAEWREATSTHFVVYADDSEKDIRKFSEQLEHFHSALEFLTGTRTDAPSPSGRVTIYIVGSDRKVKQLYGEGSKYVGGFYIPRAGGSLAIVPKVETGGKQIDFSMVTLLHEYAHHFMETSSTFPMPMWMSEGGAEFFASASFGKDGSVGIGQPAHHRAYELLLLPEVPLTELLDEKLYQSKKRRSYDSFYGRAWLLYHYLTFSEARRGQLSDYIDALVSGKPSLQAGQEVFGDLRKLDKELTAHLKARRMSSFNLKPELLKVGPVNIRTLRKAEAEMIPIVVRSVRGVDEEEAKLVLADARRVALRYPDDPFVQAALAEAEYDAGNDDLAIAAADAALAADPKVTKAYVQKGYALFRKADEVEDDEEREAAYTRAMAPFLALNKLENDHPLPLIYYYRSFGLNGERPSQLAIDGLAQAVGLAPFDIELRMTLAQELVLRGEMDMARAHLVPVAYHPHADEVAQVAGRILARMDTSSEPMTQEELMALVGAALEPDDSGGESAPES